MELPFKDDEESSEVINLLLSMGDSAAEKGTAEQEGELRVILVRAMARCSTKSRKAELAQACEAVVGEEVESRRVAENFLVKRVGATTGVLERGSTVKVRVPDARPAVCIRFSISEGVSSAEIAWVRQPAYRVVARAKCRRQKKCRNYVRGMFYEKRWVPGIQAESSLKPNANTSSSKEICERTRATKASETLSSPPLNSWVCGPGGAKCSPSHRPTT